MEAGQGYAAPEGTVSMNPFEVAMEEVRKLANKRIHELQEALHQVEKLINLSKDLLAGVDGRADDLDDAEREEIADQIRTYIDSARTIAHFGHCLPGQIPRPEIELVVVPGPGPILVPGPPIQA